MAGNHSYSNVKTFLIFGSILLLSINTTTILCMEKTKEPEKFEKPTQEKFDAILSEMEKFCNPPKKQQNNLALSLRNSTEIVPKKPKLNSYLKKQLDACFEAIRTNNQNELNEALVAGIAPGILYDGYDETLFQAQISSWKSIQGKPFYSATRESVESILSLLVQRAKEEEKDNDNDKK